MIPEQVPSSKQTSGVTPHVRTMYESGRKTIDYGVEVDEPTSAHHNIGHDRADRYGSETSCA